MSNNISLQNLRSFVTIAEAGSFTHAAEQLESSRAHLSRQLSQLEQQLGSQLLIRTTRSQRLTEAGQRFFDECQHALKIIDKAVDAVGSDNQQLQGLIRINCVGGVIGEELVANLLSDFSQAFPRVEVELDFSSPRVNLIGEGYDLVLRMGELEDSNLIARKLGDIYIEVMASPSYLNAQGHPRHPDDLTEHNCLTGSVKRWRFVKRADQHKKHAKALEVTVDGNYTCKNSKVLIQGALRGNGIVRLPRLNGREALDKGKLVPVFEGWAAPHVPFYLLYHADPHQPERIKRAIQHLLGGFETIDLAGGPNENV